MSMRTATGLAAAALVALAGCAGMKDSMPGWMPGSGAMKVSLSGAEEVPAINTGAKGQNGPVIIPLTKNGDTYSVPEGRKLTEAQMQDLKNGNLYVNVHSNAHKGGEIRAQLQP